MKKKLRILISYLIYTASTLAGFEMTHIIPLSTICSLLPYRSHQSHLEKCYLFILKAAFAEMSSLFGNQKECEPFNEVLFTVPCISS